MTELARISERGILFSPPMVDAIAKGWKTKTRREIKPQPHRAIGSFLSFDFAGDPATWKPAWGEDAANLSGNEITDANDCLRCPYGKPGDRLWVRESWRTWNALDQVCPSEIAKGTPIKYSDDVTISAPLVNGEWGKKRPGIFMPRWASRLTLEITSVRPERLNQISEADAQAEGVERLELSPRMLDFGSGVLTHVHPLTSSYYDAFKSLWESLHGPNSFDDRWVWVIEFKKV